MLTPSLPDARVGQASEEVDLFTGGSGPDTEGGGLGSATVIRSTLRTA
jgi:hypothetical protein